MSLRVAVVVPCRDSGRWLGAALGSLAAQTRRPDEIVVVDDGSTDPPTLRLLDDQAKAGIEVLRTEPRGPSAARNAAIRRTTTGLVLPLDADDRLVPTAIERLLARLEEEPGLSFVGCGMQAFGEADWSWVPAGGDLVSILSGCGPHVSTLFRRELWEAVGGFDEALPVCEELDLWARAVRAGFVGTVEAEPLLLYRVRSDSLHHGSIARGSQAAAMEAILRKHRPAIVSIAPELLGATERLLASLDSHRSLLEERRNRARADIDRLRAELVRLGGNPAAIDTPGLSSTPGRAGTRSPEEAKPEPPRRGAGRSRPGSGAVLLYHRIGRPEIDPHEIAVSPERFRSHLGLLARDFQPMPLVDLVLDAARGELPERAVAVTFDDGYFDALCLASPLLVDAGIPATFFVNARGLDEPHEFWWDRLERLLLGSWLPQEIDVEVEGSPFHLKLGSADERLEANRFLSDAFRVASFAARERALRALASHLGGELPPRDDRRPLSPLELLRLASRPGASIGAHGTDHLWLPARPPEERRAEIAPSRERLERLLGIPVPLFAYPYGAWSPEVVDETRAAGFTLAVTVDGGPVRPEGNPLLVPRNEVKNVTVGELARQLEELFG
jgi:peptidoglycan/xylan/chitin deacetylase (PgdA/CDA1 family)/GT2 family glycosyltransferase